MSRSFRVSRKSKKEEKVAKSSALIPLAPPTLHGRRKMFSKRLIYPCRTPRKSLRPKWMLSCLSLEDSRIDDKITLVKMDTVTSFIQYEVSSCVDPANYDWKSPVGISKIAFGQCSALSSNGVTTSLSSGRMTSPTTTSIV